MTTTTKHLDDSVLAQFCGTEKWHKIAPRAFLTDGALYVAKTAGAFWLMDLINSHQTNPAVRGEEFQCWNLYLRDKGCRITCDDGNGNIVAEQVVEYNDFPQDIKLWAVWQNGHMFGSYQDVFTILLPSEY
jgi:hypothetical protein